MKGIDVSKYQELIYWEKVKAAGIDFAILRAGLGKYITQIDPRFEQNAFGALSAGLHVGAYWFSYATSPKEARQEAQVCAQVLEPYKGKFDFPVYFDYEYDSEEYSKNQGVTPTQALRESLAQAFCEEIEKGGYWAGVYANKYFFTTYLDYQKLGEKYTLWVAQYNDVNTFSGKYDMWQYTSSGRVNGISGNVD